jgi:ABC-type multidrug transport system fused ATPase/permease subunit
MISLSLSTPSPETAPRLTPAQRRLVVAILGLFFGTLLAVTTIYLRYPWGNDLDEIGWLVDNLDIRRLESFANQIYPFGFFVLLYVCRAIFGSILFSAFFIQAVAVTALLFFSFRAALTLSQEFATALIALLCTMLFLSSFATTELMDGIPGALVIAGYAMAIEKRRLERSAFIIGLCIGGAFLFRYHYLPLLPISVVAFPLCFRLSWRRS